MVQKKRTGKKRREAEGYLTVEASLVMLIVIPIWIALLFLSFFLYDRCRLEQDLRTLCFRESVLKTEDGTSKGEGIRAGALSAAYVGFQGVSVDGYKKESEMTAEGSGHVVPDALLDFLPVPPSIWQVSVSVSSGIRDTPKAIRKFNRTKDVLKNAIGDTGAGDDRNDEE